MKKEIPIFFSFNDDYVIPAAVAFHTLLYMAKEDVYYRMFVLHSDISETNRVLLGSIVNKHNNATIEFINTQDFLQKAWESGNFENQKKNSYKFTRDTIIRCFASQFFLQLDKIIYSDVDVVFMDDISELWDLDLEDNYIAAVKNAFMKFDNNELSHLSYENKTKFENTYFAGGIWVMNVKKIREDNLEKKMLEVINDDSIEKKWNDQDIMNISCNNKVKYISLRYISYPYLMDIIAQEGFQSHYTREELLESLYKPKILHFAAWKPWKDSSIKRADIWWDVFTELNLKKTRIFTDKSLLLKQMKLRDRIRLKIYADLNKKLKRKGLV